MSNKLNDTALDILFRTARSYNGWEETPVSEETMKSVYELMKWGPTSMNVLPARFVYLASKEAKERLKPHLEEGNIKKTMEASVCVILAYDESFYKYIPKLSPHNPNAGKSFENNQDETIEMAKLNGTLQAAYFMLSARAHGLDCGPMLGFDKEGVNREFFSKTSYKANFLCSLGQGKAESLFPRLPRFEFDEICKIL